MLLAYVLRILRYSGFLRNLPNNMYYCKVYDYVEKVDLSKGYWNPKKMGVTMHFLYIIGRKFRKKLTHILCILKLFS